MINIAVLFIIALVFWLMATDRTEYGAALWIFTLTVLLLTHAVHRENVPPPLTDRAAEFGLAVV